MRKDFQIPKTYTVNNKDFINAIADKLGMPAKKVQQYANVLVQEMAEHMDDETQLCIPSFGIFEVKKKMERIVMNPSTKQRKLVPPKLVMSFKQSSVLKEKIN